MSQVQVKDGVTGVERRDRMMKERLMGQFVHYDGISRPYTQEYGDGWDRIFGKKEEERPDSVDIVTRPFTPDLQAPITMTCASADCYWCVEHITHHPDVCGTEKPAADYEAPQISHTSDESSEESGGRGR